MVPNTYGAVNGKWVLFCTYGEKCWRVMEATSVENRLPRLRRTGKARSFCWLEVDNIRSLDGNGDALA